MATAALPPALEDVDSGDEWDPAAPRPLAGQGTRYMALGSSGYVDDTQAVAPGVAAFQGTALATGNWL